MLVCKIAIKSKESHYKATNRILKYFKGTINVGLWYPSDSKITLSGFPDSEYAECKLDWKSTSGTCHLLGPSLISPNRKKKLVWYSPLLRRNT